MNEVKHERFLKVVEKRMEVLINDFYKLGNCASKVSYEYTESEVNQIFERLIVRETFSKNVLKENKDLL